MTADEMTHKWCPFSFNNPYQAQPCNFDCMAFMRVEPSSNVDDYYCAALPNSNVKPRQIGWGRT